MLSGRVALITGGASGIGRAIALRLAEEGAYICIMSLSRDRVQLLPGELKYFASTSELQETRKAVEGLGSQCLAIEGDVSAPSDVSRMVSAAVKDFGRLDILVNNAATSCVHPVLDHNDESFLRVIMVNLFGAYLCTKTVLPHMISGGWGRVISIASTSAHVAAANYGAYTASKHGLLGFSRSVALEVAQNNITVNTISPGTVETPSTPLHIGKSAEQAGFSLDEMRKRWLSDYPQKRFVLPEEIAGLVSYLCTDEARAINGEDIRVTTGAMW
jgi:NAD(P)-dependent dehydrogenase (short-subunit alcohol dehydrogenase family)